MLQAVPILTELDYSTVIPAVATPPPDSFGSGSSQFMDSSFSTFAEALQFTDFGPKVGIHPNSNEPGDSSHNHYMLKFPVLNDHHHKNVSSCNEAAVQIEFLGASGSHNQMMVMNTTTEATPSDYNNDNDNNDKSKKKNNNGKRKRARMAKTRQEVESQRMSHIAVERNRRKQMNEHLRVLRTLMPSSYVQRGDQASIIGGAIEFVRELEQLLQCLESQKRRRLYGETNDNTGVVPLPLDPNNQPFDPNNDQTINVGPGVDLAGVIHEETAENKSTVADIEVKLLGFDAFIKILSRRRHGQLIKAISGLQDLQFTILHTNITTVEQTVLYSFNVKISSETSFSAEDIASCVQQIFTFIHANSAI